MLDIRQECCYCIGTFNTNVRSFTTGHAHPASIPLVAACRNEDYEMTKKCSITKIDDNDALVVAFFEAEKAAGSVAALIRQSTNRRIEAVGQFIVTDGGRLGEPAKDGEAPRKAFRSFAAAFSRENDGKTLSVKGGQVAIKEKASRSMNPAKQAETLSKHLGKAASMIESAGLSVDQTIPLLAQNLFALGIHPSELIEEYDRIAAEQEQPEAATG